MAMRLTESVRQLNEGEQALGALSFFELFQPFQDPRIKREASSSSPLSSSTGTVLSFPERRSR